MLLKNLDLNSIQQLANGSRGILIDWKDKTQYLYTIMYPTLCELSKSPNTLPLPLFLFHQPSLRMLVSLRASAILLALARVFSESSFSLRCFYVKNQFCELFLNLLFQEPFFFWLR
jgi:hypothetical protein